VTKVSVELSRSGQSPIHSAAGRERLSSDTARRRSPGEWRPEPSTGREKGRARTVTVAKKKKQHQKPESAAATLEEIQSRGDRIADWIGQNPMPILGAGAAVLALAAGVGLFFTQRESALEASSAALSEVRLDYREAMGASPNVFEIPEPASPKLAQEVREEYVGRFEAVAEEYSGATAGLALLEAGSLQQQLGEDQKAIETWQTALSHLSGDDPLRGIVLERIAGGQEQQGDFAAAAQTHAEAAEIQNYPLRYSALVNAARCLAEAGDTEGAIAAFARVERESPDLNIPPHTQARLRELRAAQSL
jgi:tetratricopeptide (TPR) repeat protein